MLILRYERELAEHKRNLSLLQRKNWYLEKEIAKLRCKPPNNCSKSDVDGDLNCVLDRHCQPWKGGFVARVIWNGLDGALQPHLLALARKHLRKHVFTPFNILRVMDIAGGTLSYEGIDVI
jgi:hypothetical protein